MTAHPPVGWAAYADCPECGAREGEPCRIEQRYGGLSLTVGLALNAPHKLRDTKAQPSLFAPTEETP